MDPAALIARTRALIARRQFLAASDPALWAAQSLPAGPERDEMRLVAAIGLERSRQHAMAFERLDALVAERPDYAAALARRGANAYWLGRDAEARTDLLCALERDPDDVFAWESAYLVAHSLRDDALAARALLALERLGAANGYLYHLSGRRHLQAERPAEAEAALRRACTLGGRPSDDPAAATTLLEAGHAFVTAEGRLLHATACADSEPEGALDHLDLALRLGFASPERHAAAVRLAGRLLVDTGHRDEALAIAADLTERYPDEGQAWLARASIDGDSASFARAHALSPAAAALAYASHLHASGATREALDLCCSQLARDPLDGDAWHLAAELHHALAEGGAACTAWREATAVGHPHARTARVRAYGPEDGMDHFEQGLELLDAGRRVDAAAAFDEAARRLRGETRAPGDTAMRHVPRALYNAAFLREHQVDDALLEPPLREALALDPRYTDAMAALGNVCARTGRADEALAWFERIATVDPSLGQPWYYIARHHAGRGDPAAALAPAARAGELYAAAGQHRFAADAAMLRGEAHDALGQLHEARDAYDLAYRFGHPIGYARGDDVRQRIALAEPDGPDARALLDKVVGRIEDGEYPWAEVDFFRARLGASQEANALAARLREGQALSPEETGRLVDFLLTDATP